MFIYCFIERIIFAFILLTYMKWPIAMDNSCIRTSEWKIKTKERNPKKKIISFLFRLKNLNYLPLKRCILECCKSKTSTTKMGAKKAVWNAPKIDCCFNNIHDFPEWFSCFWCFGRLEFIRFTRALKPIIMKLNNMHTRDVVFIYLHFKLGPHLFVYSVRKMYAQKRKKAKKNKIAQFNRSI